MSEPIAYGYEADNHCPACTEKRFGRNERGFIAEGSTDNEGNPVGAQFAYDETPEAGLYCGDCGSEIAEPSEEYESKRALEACDAFTLSYIEAALWSSMDGDEPLDRHYSAESIEPDTIEEMRKDCERFRAENVCALAAAQLSDERAGFCFWLNRNRHGSGFWDEAGLSKALGEQLSEASHAFGEYYLEAHGSYRVQGFPNR